MMSASEKRLPIEDNRRKACQYFRNGVGNSEPSVQGSLWAAYNGITELVDHRTNYTDKWQRMKSCCFGNRSTPKQRAFEMACELVKGA
jgi:hypothetical protein